MRRLHAAHFLGIAGFAAFIGVLVMEFAAAATPQLAAGVRHSLALHADGTVYAWGDNTYGQLGNGSQGEGLFSSRPVQVEGLSDIVALATLATHNLALKADGTVWAWGRNASGQLGDGTQTDRATPVQVTDLRDVAAIAVGELHSLAVRSDGSLWVWGANGGGRFGNGLAGWDEISTIPIRVLGMNDVTAVAANWGTPTFALKTDGSLWVWGSNERGELGLGYTSESELSPMQVTALSAVTHVVTYAGHSMAQTEDGQLWVWGEGNDHGQFGDGTTEPSAVPVRVQQPAGDIAEFALGYRHSLARLTDGTLWTWGNNWYGQLGRAGDDDPLPVRVELSAVEAIAAGNDHSLAMTADGAVWAWGDGGQGRLGVGDEYGRDRPDSVLAADGSGTLNLYGDTPPPTETITLSVSYEHNGRVTSADGAIDCPGTCSAVYAPGTLVTLDIDPQDLADFIGWGAACAGVSGSRCTLTMETHLAVRAFFAADELPLPDGRQRLNVGLDGFGRVFSSDGAIDCPGTCVADYASGTAVTLNIDPEDIASFLAWGGACAQASGASCVLDMSADRSVLASFETGILNRPSDTDWRVAEIYIATLGYAPDHEGLRYWVEQIETDPNWTPSTVAQSFFDQPLVQALYPADQDASALIEALYQNLFARVADADGLAYWSGELAAGSITRNQMVVTLLNGGWANPEAVEDMMRFGYQVEVGLAFAEAQAERGIGYSQLSDADQAALRQAGREVLANVTADSSTRDAAIARIPTLLESLLE